MIWLGIAIVVAFVFLFVWVLCRMRQIEDDRMDERVEAITRRGE